MPELVVFTCASGKQCAHIIPLLYSNSAAYTLRLVVNSPHSLERLQKQYPEAQVLRANLSDPQDCAKIVDGASVVFYISPTFHPQESQFGYNVIDAAVEESQRPSSKFAHFILSSVLHPYLRKMLNHDRKRYIEEYLVESSLPWTILQPSHFMDNTITRILQLRTTPNAEATFLAAHNPDVTFSFSCLYDFAEASAKVIQERSRHYFATYQLVSTWPMKYSDYIQEVGSAMGKTVNIKHTPFEEVVDLYTSNVFGRADVDLKFKEGPARMLLYYNGRGLMANPRMTEWLLERPATSPFELAKMLLAVSEI